MKKYLITAVHDNDANVYVATSKDIKGLTVEAETLDDVVEECCLLIPELMEENASGLIQYHVVFNFAQHQYKYLVDHEPEDTSHKSTCGYFAIHKVLS